MGRQPQIVIYGRPTGRTTLDAPFKRYAIHINNVTYVSDGVPANDEGNPHRFTACRLAPCQLETLWYWSAFRESAEGQLAKCRCAILEDKIKSKKILAWTIRRLAVLRCAVSDKEVLAEVVACLKILGADEGITDIPQTTSRKGAVYLDDRMVRLDPESVALYIERLTK